MFASLRSCELHGAQVDFMNFNSNHSPSGRVGLSGPERAIPFPDGLTFGNSNMPHPAASDLPIGQRRSGF